MRVVFFGTSEFAVPALKKLAARHEVVLCVTQPDRPQGRGLALAASAVKEAALALHLPVIQPERLTLADVASASADIGVVASFGQIIRREVIDYYPHGILGIHPSLLPKYRGASPVASALLSGETITGVAIFRINEALDAGPVLITHQVAIDPDETAEALTRRLAGLGAEETLRALDLIDSHQAQFIPQDESQTTWAPKLSKAQGEINWLQPALKIANQVRGLAPWPGAFTFWQGEVLKVWSASLYPDASSGQGKPGQVLACDGGSLVVAAGEGKITIKEVQLPGKKKISAKEFISGYRVSAGNFFGNQSTIT